MFEIEPYPLYWPLGYPRTEEPRKSQFKLTLAQAIDGLEHELKLWRADAIVISCNATMGRGGGRTLVAGNKDNGAAVYFTRNGEQWSIPCDEYQSIRDNVQALKYIVEYLRGIERHGGSHALRSASSKFKALPAPGETAGVTCWEILGVAPGSSRLAIRKAFQEKAQIVHPDKPGGSEDKFNRLIYARDQAIGTILNSGNQ